MDLTLSKARPADGRHIAYQKDAPNDLKAVSWPPGKSAKDLNYYSYDTSGGQDVILYLVEEGINPRNPVSVPDRTSLPFLTLRYIRNLLSIQSPGSTLLLSPPQEPMMIRHHTVRAWHQRQLVLTMDFRRAPPWLL